MFCATLFTHMRSQHLGPVGPPSGLVHRWAWQGCHRSLGAVARVEGGKGRIWKEHSLGASAQGLLCPFCAMKGRKWGRSASQGSEPTLTPCVSSGREKEILRRGETMLEAGFQQRMLSFIQIIFFKLVRRRGCAFYAPVKDPPALYASHFSPLTVQCGSEF